ncbi:hypothetical protein T484DRAFT_1786109 [Baffinella frigidus]|nr:hypothetical protein T484DRAFT_1786109 [Cryptophyta sp. CCMP2293]
MQMNMLVLLREIISREMDENLKLALLNQVLDLHVQSVLAAERAPFSSKVLDSHVQSVLAAERARVGAEADRRTRHLRARAKAAESQVSKLKTAQELWLQERKRIIKERKQQEVEVRTVRAETKVELTDKAAQLQRAFEDRVVSQMREAEATTKVAVLEHRMAELRQRAEQAEADAAATLETDAH